MASKSSSRARSVTASRIAAGRSEGKMSERSPAKASSSSRNRVPLSRRSTLPKKQNGKVLDKTTRGRKSRIPAQRRGPGPRAEGKTQDRRVEQPASEEFFVYKNVQNHNDGANPVSMDQGCAKQTFTNVSGANAYCAMALYSWLGRNCDSWGATEVKCELQEDNDTGIARYTYDSMVLMRNGERQLAASHNHGQGDDHNHESNTGLWHRVGELFNREQIRQRKIKHGKADAVENGPKEISIFCPNDPTIKIVDLSEDERNRDECLVLNIAAPDVSSRLVLFCNAHSLDDDEEEDEDEDDGFSEEDVQSSEL
eukprot:g4192.t1